MERQAIVGRNKMNALIKILPFITLLTVSYTVKVDSKEKLHKKIDVKCFVELVGGGEQVIFWNISSKKLSGLSQSIIGHKVTVHNSKQKAKIYKAHECILLKDEFTSVRAKRLDKDTAR
ncbi:hypothetical protein A9Q74_04040 [Colwellia sp. 39_35_sub15_T18]|nr:hypothetical protein A9Q74_04040 [Colwellia sp. 39_35_sub15_T18]